MKDKLHRVRCQRNSSGKVVFTDARRNSKTMDHSADAFAYMMATHIGGRQRDSQTITCPNISEK